MTRLRFSFARLEDLKYLSHLDMMRLFQRALRRSGLPLAYSQGFNPHLRFNLALPLPLGVTGNEEFGELYLEDTVSPPILLKALKPHLPGGLELIDAYNTHASAPSLPSQVHAALYSATPDTVEGEIKETYHYKAALERLLAKREIMVSRTRKKGKTVSTNVRPYIIEANISDVHDGEKDFALRLEMLLKAGSEGGVAPAFVTGKVEEELGAVLPRRLFWRLHRIRLYMHRGGSLQPLIEGM